MLLSREGTAECRENGRGGEGKGEEQEG